MERNGGSSSTSLAPGFRFHPTDEELVFYYLRRKVSGKPFRFDAISDIDVYKCEPWDLPGLSKLKSRDLEWYFFSNLDKKYGNGSRTNRATIEGYWKTTGKDRPVQHRSRVVGMKKTLVYHRGRAPRGERSNWVMHEYKLADDELENTNVPQESFVLCRIFHKSGSGPKNGEKYGAPFVEEEWEEDDHLEVAGKPASDDSMTNGSVTEGSCHNQEHAMETPMKYPTPLLTCYEGDSSNVTETLAENELNSSTMVNEEQKSYPLPGQLEEAFNNDYVTQPTNISSQAPINYLPVEQCFDNVNSAPLDEVLFLEADDLLQPIEENSSDFQLLDEYLQYFDADNDIEQRVAFDPSDMLDVDNILYDQSFLPDQNVDQSNMQPFKSYQQLPEPYSIESASFSEQVMVAQKSKPDHDVGQYLPFESSYMLDDFDSILYDQAFLLDQNLDQGDKQISAVDQHIPEAYSASTASSSGQITEAQNLKPDSKYSFMKQASEMLGNFPTHPAFASEFPTKEMSTKLDAAMKFSKSVDLSPGIARDGEVPAKEKGVCWSLDKCGNVNVILSFIVPEGIVIPVGIEAVSGIISRKMTSAVSRRWPYFLFFSALALCISSKVGTCI